MTNDNYVKLNKFLMKYQNFCQNIENWYVTNKRNLPWRSNPTSYRVWLAEIVFQQTQINQGMGHYKRLIDEFPDVKALANAREDDVLKLWEGLGYYARARNLHKAAKKICAQGHFPQTAQEWEDIPGVGPYTAAAIASVCSDEKIASVDGNVMRVLARTHAIPDDIRSSSTQKEMRIIANKIIDKAESPGNFNQGMMELGALICSAKTPQCNKCPVQNQCLLVKNQLDPGMLPFKSKAKARRVRHLHFAIASEDDFILLERRPNTGIWAGLYQFPCCEGKTPSFEKIGTLVKKNKHLLSHQEIHYYIWDIKEWTALPMNKDDYQTYNTLKPLPALPRPLKKFADEFGYL